MATRCTPSGSSPLTRGKLHLLGNDRRIIRLIPAHAGKTRSARGSKPNRWAHPRSRGENQGENIVNLSKQGSSPLTRGKRRLVEAFGGAAAAHPRSRGENVTTVTKARAVEGSSPLTRGKPTPCIDRGGADRLIPAHAGKTSYPTKPRPHLPAHPRSRGENDRCDCRVDLVKGSSPLTRGKPGKLRLIQSRSGLIPAHAGKTARQPPRRAAHPAHPRSRGENLKSATLARNVTGSSPLTRGKPHKAWTKALQARLIPAHAGKTAHSTHSTCAAWAHPRSRGENSEKTAGGAGNRGSSPLTRGKQRSDSPDVSHARLIPAHAGKTTASAPSQATSTAHPRSRGENRSRHSREQ